MKILIAEDDRISLKILEKNLKEDVSITLGCSVSNEGREPTAKSLIEASDAALYMGKSGGRNRVAGHS